MKQQPREITRKKSPFFRHGPSRAKEGLFTSEDDVSTRITWGGYGFEEEGTTMIIRLQELYFDELPCTLLGAYVVAYASKCFWGDAVTPSDLDFRFRIPDGKIQPVAARFEAGPFAIDIAKMMETVCFIN